MTFRSFRAHSFYIAVVMKDRCEFGIEKVRDRRGLGWCAGRVRVRSVRVRARFFKLLRVRGGFKIFRVRGGNVQKF